MTGDELQMRALHDRATRGKTLTADEQAQLDAWYAVQDAAETVLLGDLSAPDDLRDLQAGVEQAITHILATSRRIRELDAQNTGLRFEIAELQQRLHRLPSSHAA
jgi:predicted  nucleic acid-binding Zn-ribbon protein